MTITPPTGDSAQLPEVPASELRFHFRSGRPCLDLVATVGERWRQNFERLREPVDLARWTVAAGILAEQPTVTENDLARARELREVVYRLAHPRTRSVPAPADVAVLNAAAAVPDLVPTLRTAEAAAARTTPIGGSPIEATLSTLARDAIDLLSGPLRDRIRECSASDCALLFVDASRPGRRRWCSMEACGNRSKTAAYRRRRTAE